MASEDYAKVLLFSDDSSTRAAIMQAVGRRPSKNAPLIEWDETATAEAVIDKVTHGSYDLLILDGETPKEGGMSVSRRMHVEMDDVPPVLMLTARPQDAWLATWSEADDYIEAPYDPMEIQKKVSALLEVDN